MDVVNQQGVAGSGAQPWRGRQDQPGTDGRVTGLPELVGVLRRAERPPLEHDRSAVQVAQESEGTVRSVEPDLVTRHTEPPRGDTIRQARRTQMVIRWTEAVSRSDG